MKGFVLVGLLLFSTITWAADIIDVHGLTGGQASHIIQKYSKKISVLETNIASEYVKDEPDLSVLSRLMIARKKLIADIKHEGPFAFVELETVSYANRNDRYTTIEIIEDRQLDRLRFVNQASNIYPSSKHHDVIDKMHQFELKAIKLIMNKSPLLDNSPCPVYHCLLPFTHPDLKPYLSLFNDGVKREKQTILHALDRDPNPERRAAAAFLLGHAQNPQDILDALLPHVVDPDNHVRNNVLRVIAETISKAHITDLDMIPFVALLDSPYVTDRNKALAILVMLVDSEQGKHNMLQMGGSHLIDLLRLHQPNNHNLAYQILQKISHKNYGEHQIAAWNSWVMYHQTTASRVT